MARPDQEKCRLCSKLDSQEAQQRHGSDGDETDAGIQRFAIIAVPIIATGESGTMRARANSVPCQPQAEIIYSGREFSHWGSR